jgi:type II secretory pathway pseudopilin PulG
MSRVMTTRARDGEAGFSLPEVMIAMLIMMIVMAGTFTAMTNAMDSERTARQITGMNNNLRASMDLIVRDMLQVGQGLPVGRRVGVPNGVGAARIARPGPAAAGACAGAVQFPDEPSLPALTVGPDLGPAVNGQCTDVVTTIAADGGNSLSLNVTSIAANGRSLTVLPITVNRTDGGNISDVPDADGDNIRAGDLLMVTKGSTSVLMQVTAVAGQLVTFGTGAADPLGLNQFDVPTGMLGTINRLKAEGTVDNDAPVLVGGNPTPSPGTGAARVRMVTYFINTAIDPANPRLMRVVNGGVPNAVAFDVQAMRLTYDLADGAVNPAGARMTTADLTTVAGACAPSTCSENQIKKVNIVLALRSSGRSRQTNDFFRNTLFTQVSLRNLAFVDEYP